jgi:hypothetical protein
MDSPEPKPQSHAMPRPIPILPTLRFWLSFVLLIVLAAPQSAASAYGQLIEAAGGSGGSAPAVNPPTPVDGSGNNWNSDEARQARWEARQEQEAERERERQAAEKARQEEERKLDALQKERDDMRDCVSSARSREAQLQTAAQAAADKVAQQTPKTQAARQQLAGLRPKAATAADRLKTEQEHIEAVFHQTMPLVPLNEGALDKLLPGRVYDAQTTRQAQQEVERLEKFSGGLDERLAALRGWRAKGSRDLAEWDRLHKDAWWEAMSNSLGLMPGGEFMNEKFGFLPTPAVQNHWDSGLAALKALAEMSEARHAPTANDQEKKLHSVLSDSQDALLKEITASLPKPQRDQIEKWQKGLVAADQILVWVAQQKADHKSPTPDQGVLAKAGPWLELAMDVASTYSPQVAKFKSAAGLIEAGANSYVTGKTISQLKAVETDNWNAERHLLAKKAEVERRIRELRISANLPLPSEGGR